MVNHMPSHFILGIVKYTKKRDWGVVRRGEAPDFTTGMQVYAIALSTDTSDMLQKGTH
jgi:hypothetical protein